MMCKKSECKCKNKFIYIVLHNLIKKCKIYLYLYSYDFTRQCKTM
jgi:hypothetical protein